MTRIDYTPADFATDDPEAARTARLKEKANAVLREVENDMIDADFDPCLEMHTCSGCGRDLDYEGECDECAMPRHGHQRAAMVAALTCLCTVWCAPRTDASKVKAMVYAETRESAFRRGPTPYAAETQRRVWLMLKPLQGVQS